MTPLLLLGLFGLLALTSKAKRSGGDGPVPIGPGSEAFQSMGGDWLAYKPQYAAGIIRGLLHRYVTPTEQPNVVMVLPGEGNRVITLAEGGAWYGLREAHANGYSIWVPLDAHWHQSAMAPQFWVLLPPGEDPPTDYALLILPDEPWPPLD